MTRIVSDVSVYVNFRIKDRVNSMRTFVQIALHELNGRHKRHVLVFHQSVNINLVHFKNNGFLFPLPSTAPSSF